MKRQSFTTAPLLAFCDSINNGKEISFSSQLDTFDGPKVGKIFQITKIFIHYFCIFWKILYINRDSPTSK